LASLERLVKPENHAAILELLRDQTRHVSGYRLLMAEKDMRSLVGAKLQ